MTVKEALISETIYPVPDNTVEKICIERGLDSSIEFTLLIAESDSYRLAKADVYMWLYISPSVREQEIAITQADKDNYYKLAMLIYGELNDPKFDGNSYGFKGEDFDYV